MFVDMLKGARGSVDNKRTPQQHHMGAGVEKLGIVTQNREVWSFSLPTPPCVVGVLDVLDVAIGSHGWYVI